MAKDDKNVNLTFKVTADTTNLDDIASKVKQVMEQAVKKTQLVKIDADTSEAEGKIAGISKRIDLANRYDKATINIKANDTDAVKTINELQDKIKGLTVKLDTSKLKSQLNEKLQELNNDESLKKVKLGVNTKSLLTEVNKAITSINNDESLKKLKLGVDSKYLQTQLNKAVKELDATVKLKTKLDTSSRRSDTKGTVTTTKTSKEESDAYQSLFSKRASAIQNMDKAYQEFGRDSKELRGAFREFLSASREMRKFGRDTGVLSLNKINSDLERLIGANLSNDFVKNALLKERDKILRDRDVLDRTLNPDKYARLDAKAKVKQLEAEHASVDAELKQRKQELAKAMAEATNYYKRLKAEKSDFAATRKQQADYYKQQRKEEEAQQRLFNLNEKNHAIFQRESAKTDLLTMSQSSKASGVFNEEQFSNFKSRLEEYRGLIDNFSTNFYKKIGKELGITDESHPFYKELQKMYQDEKERDKAWDKKVSTTAIKSETAELEKQADIKQKISDVDAKLKSLRDNEVTQQKSVNTALKANYKAAVDREKEEKELLRVRKALNIELSKSNLLQLAQSAKADRRLDSDKMQKFMDELQNYRNLTGNYMPSFFTKTGRELGIKSDHPYFNAMRTLYQSNLRDEAEWRKKPLTANVDVKGSEKVEELNQKVLTTTQQFMRLRGEALKAGNALNQATDPKDIARLKTEFEKAIQALVNYQRATRGLTKGGEAQLVEKLAVGNIKEQTEAWKVLYEWVKKTVQAQRDYDIGVGRRNPPKSKDTDLMSYFKNIDWGRALSGMAYAARGELNTVQSFGNLLSSMSQISGVVGTLAKGLGAFFAIGLAVAGIINVITNAFTQLTSVLGQVATTIYNILRPGIELYKQRQTAELAVAAAISSRAREDGKQVPFERGLEISKELMQRVIIDAAKSAFNPQELIDALRGTLPLAFGKGMNLEQAYDLTKGVASVAKVINLAPNQVLQELRDILQGTISARSSQVAGATGMTGEELREAEAQGRLYEYISEHLKNFTIALNKYAETLAGALDRLSETWAMGMEAVFQRLAPVVNNLLNAFVDNFIGVYKDKNTGEIIDTSNSENLKNPETGEYRELVPEFSIYIKQFASALEDLIIFIAPIIDEILEFIQELTGQVDPINAVTVLIEYAIRIMVTLGEVLLQMIFDMAEALIKWEKPISWLLGLMKGIVKATYHMDEALLEFGITIQNVLFAIWKAITRVGSWDDVGKAASEGMNNVTESSKKMMEDIKQGLTTTSYDEVLGIDRGERPEKGLVERFVDEAREKAQAEENKHAGKPVDYSAVQGMAKDNKQNLANLRKAMQAAIEDIKQALKDALAQLKDIAERNELAYRQGYKSVEDYFTQKAQIEYQEAQLKLDALQKEYALVSALDTGTDEGAKYQKDRDLIKLNGEIVIQQREFTKKQEQLLEVAQHIENHMANQTYKYGIQPKSVGGINSSANYNISNADLESWGVNNDMPMSAIKGILKASKELGVDPRLVMAMAMQESGGYQSAVSPVGARGVMQLMPDTAEGLGVDPYDEWENIYGGVKYILQQLEYFGGDMVKAIAAYNAGPGAVDEYGGIPPYEETQNYVKNILSMYEEMGGLNTVIEETTGVIENTTNELHGRMPEAVTTLGEAVEKAVAEGQNQMIEAQKKYASYLNEPYLYETISSAEVSAKYNKQIEIARARYGQMIPAIANYLELAFPVEKLKVEAKSLEQFVDNRLKWIEDDSLAMNKRLREKTVLFPQAIDTYISYFSEKINDWAITDLLEKMAQKADELAKLGAVSEARDITKKIIEVRSKFVSMIQSWIDEMSNYFNYRKELVNADSGLTSFVKEERVKQLEKGEARVKAVAYAQEAVKLDELQTKYQEQLTKVIEGRNDELDKTMQTDTKLLEMSIAQLETEKQRALRQAEINAKLGEQKTLWQETMDAANQALENGLYNFMTDYINTAESIGEAFRNMAIDILKDLQKFFAKKAITDLMHVITGTPNEQYNAPNTAEVQTAYNTNAMVYWLQNIYTAIGSLQTAQTTSMFTNLGGSMVGGTYIPNTSPSFIPGAGQKRATGGYISGPGTSTSDSIHAMLSNGEYVIKADAVRKYGLNFLDAVNSGHFTRMKTVIPRFADGGYVGDALQDTARGMTDFAKNIGTSVSTTNNMNVALVRNEQEAYEHFMRSPAGQRILVDFQKGNGRVFARFNR